MFESFVYQHLVTYFDELDASVFHYRDSNGLEADAIVQARSGEWLAIAVKLGAGQVDAAAQSLLKLQGLIAGTPPSALFVITATGYAYTRPDGVRVVPLSLLGP